MLALFSLLATFSHAETVTYYINDALGSPVAAMDSAGTVIWRESYNPFGEGRKKPSQNNNDVGFTGHQKDDATGLTYMQARYYDPTIGRFYGVDPAPFSNVQNFNRFAYANNNPYKYTDPNGKKSLWTKIKNLFKSAKEIAKEEMKEKIKGEVKEKGKGILRDILREGGMNDQDICQLEHCAGRTPSTSICLIKFCAEETGLVDKKKNDKKKSSKKGKSGKQSDKNQPTKEQRQMRKDIAKELIKERKNS